MASGVHTFMTCVVFSAEKFQGNRLAIVSVRGNALTDERKSLIAKEFGFSETVFLHDAPGPGQPRRLDIFTEKGEEIPFAGHPVIGAAHFIFMFIERIPYAGPQANQRQSAVLLTKAGPVPVFFNTYRQVAACAVPHNVHVHKSEITFDDVLAVQPQVQIVPTVNKVKGKSFPIVSLVKGMTFCLVDLTDAPDVLKSLKPSEAPAMKLDEDWNVGFSGALYYERRGSQEQAGEPTIYNMHVRMITQGMEDPGTGSGNCALACYLALNSPSTTATTVSSGPAKAGATTGSSKGFDPEAVKLAEQTEKLSVEDQKNEHMEHHVFAVEQGIEMGRKCTLAIEVDIKQTADGKRVVAGVMLSGRAMFMLRGELVGVY